MADVGSLVKRIGIGRRALAEREQFAADAAPAAMSAAASVPAPDAAATDLELTLGEADKAILERCRPYTMTSAMRLLALLDGVRHVARREIPGAFAECGVWRGGSVLAMVMALQQLGIEDREIHLFDTFEGMTEPTERDTSRFHTPALDEWRAVAGTGARAYDALFNADVFDEQSVRETVASTGYPASRLHFHRGDVLHTIPAAAPERLALLRLDTDWYESTKHELRHLYPRLALGGILIIDDYGHWEGARHAVDEYFNGAGPLLSRIDYTGRLAVKDREFGSLTGP